jgi:hypothetical protein
MRIFYLGTTADVDLVPCEKGDPCAYDHTCRIHRVYEFFKQAGLVGERSSLELASPVPPPVEYSAVRVWAGTRADGWMSAGWIANRRKIEITGGKLLVDGECFIAFPVKRQGPGTFWYLGDSAELKSVRDEPFASLCRWCAEGNPRIPSSVSDVFVHTDTPVGRVLCDQRPLADRLLKTVALPEGFPRECEFGRID